jgi:hypothetical protein
MGKQFTEISKKFQQFIEEQKIFFVGTAASDGRVNVSPKGMDSLRVIDPNKVIWLNLTGSGNETAAHLLKNNRMTIMFCAFKGNPLILRLYGEAKIYHPRDDFFQKNIKLFNDPYGTRQIIEMNIDMVQSSCGFGVPFMEFKENRSKLGTWSQDKDPDQLKEYWKEKNAVSIDGFDTGILE